MVSVTLVFTNGCFDILHPGHVDFLARARALGDRLVIGLNSDASIRTIKGPDRPLVPQADREAMLRALRAVDDVVIFDEPTPARLIAELRPDVLVKGGDWPPGQIVGADVMLAHGGRVCSLPLLGGYSTSALVERIRGGKGSVAVAPRGAIGGVGEHVLAEHVAVMGALGEQCGQTIEQAGRLIVAALRAGRRLFLCGNGGSAADAEHIAAEFLGRFEGERRPYPAIALGGSAASLTALANDYGFEEVFARQVRAMAGSGDVLVAISTSGASPNVLAAVMAARSAGCAVVGLTSERGTRLASLCDVAVMVPAARVARIQEAHGTIGHIWCEMFDAARGDGDTASGSPAVGAS
jgi:D-sedoheptulose 7-phosphate isomerase